MKNNYFTIIVTLLTTFAIYSQQFSNLGVNNYPQAVTNEGVVAGTTQTEYFYWTAEDGITMIGGSFGFAPFGRSTGISDDGLFIAGNEFNPSINFNEMAIYDVVNEDWTLLGSFNVSLSDNASLSNSISGDGSTVVGLVWVVPSGGAARWTSSDGFVDLGTTIPDRSTGAWDVNNDGSVIVGYQDDMTGFRQGAFWVDGVQSLITTNTGGFVPAARTVSANGVWAGGNTSGNILNPWKYNINTGDFVLLGPPLDPSFDDGTVTGFSEDGTIAVGYYRPLTSFFGGSGFIHTDEQGIIDLNEYANEQGINTNGVQMVLPYGMSKNAEYIVGYGLDTNSNVVGFVLHINPATLSVDNFEQDISLDIYPNPAKEVININASSHIDAIRIYNILGSQMIIDKGSASSFSKKIDTSKMARGVYLMEVEINQRSFMHKIILD